MLFAVRDLLVDRANLLMNDYAAGLPSPLAFLGLAAAAAPSLDAGRWSIGVLPVMHEVRASQGRTKPEMTPKGGSFRTTEIMEDFVGRVRVSLLLNIPGCEDPHKVGEALGGRRLAGGVIENGRIDVQVMPADGRSLAKLSRGYALVVPIRPEQRLISSGTTEGLTAIASLLYQVPREPGSGWLVPVAVGHRLLENPDVVPRRRNTRDPSVPHVFTEPVVGIAELVSVRSPRLTSLDQAGMSALLWRWCAKGEWIVGHPDYHPDHLAAANQESANG